MEEKDRVRLKRRSLEAVLEQCQKALELLNNDSEIEYLIDEEIDDVICEGSVSGCVDTETNELGDLLKSKFECCDFLKKLENPQVSVVKNPTDEGSSWDMVTENDLWENENIDADKEDYVLVRQEDIIDGIASFMAAYLLSLKQTKELTPNQLQDALSKAFSVKRKKGKLWMAWDGSKVIYNVASWSATAVGIYQNPVLFRVTAGALWTSCGVISKFF